MTVRREKLTELARKLAAQFIQIESNNTSLITVTRVEVTEDEKRAIVLVTVLPETREREALAFLDRKQGEMRSYFKEHARVRSLPHFEFKIDIGERTRQKIDELGREPYNNKA